MDFHQIDNVTVEAVKTAHMADVEVQEEFGVRYHQFWVNEDAGTVFCLVEGPDAATCELVHRKAHGNLACALTEVEAGFYEKMMGHDHKLDQGYVSHSDGSFDLGYRHIVALSVYGITGAENSKDFSLFENTGWATGLARKTIASFGGREIRWENDDWIFISSLTQKLCNSNKALPTVSLRFLNEKEEAFTSALVKILESKLGDENFDLNRLATDIGISRPQLYRKIVALSGRSPNDFVHDIKLERALELLRQRNSNVSEVAYETGFNSPSYFTKCFKDKFGLNPSVLFKNHGPHH